MASGKGIEIEADAAWQDGEWRAQRVLWVLGALLLAAATAGVFGSGGPLATARLSDGTVTLEYERFDRRDAPAELVIGVGSAANEVTIELGRALTERIDIEGVIPEPDSSALTARGFTMIFTSAGEGLEDVTIEYRADRAGVLPIEVSVNGQQVRARSFVYP